MAYLIKVGENEEMSIKEVAEAIVKAVDFQGKYSVRRFRVLYSWRTLKSKNLMFVQFDTSRPDGQFRKPASNEKLLNLIGEFEFTPFERGSYYLASGLRA